LRRALVGEGADEVPVVLDVDPVGLVAVGVEDDMPRRG
jgi:hypothetical protein